MTDPANPTPRAIDRSTIEIDPRRVRVLFGGHVVADSRRAVILREPSRQPVWYFPRGDVEMTVLGQTRRQTVSPAKGVASYFTIYRDAHVVQDAIWSFEAPPPALGAIAGHIGFMRLHFEFEAEGHAAIDWDLAAAPRDDLNDAA